MRRDSEARLQALLSSLDDVVFELDENGTYLGVWTTDETLLAAPRSELLGGTIGERIGEEIGLRFTRIIRHVLETGCSETCEYSLNVPAGTRWFQGRLAPIAAWQGLPTSVCLLVRDITVQKLAEQSLMESEERFRSIFDQAPIGILCLDACGRITDANRALCEIVGKPRDELDGSLQAEVPTALSQSKEGIERVATIVRAMKAFGRPDPSEPEPMDINPLVTYALTMVRNELKYVAEVTTDLGPLPTVSCFPGAIGQVVINLVVNAAYAVGESRDRTGERGEIKVKTWSEGDRVALSVSDTGPGIPPDVLPRIFQPFFTTKPFGRGSGQGLAMAWATVVDRHAGRIEVATSGAGTTFKITIPVAGPIGGPEALSI